MGPVKKFGAVTQMRYYAPIFKYEFLPFFFCVGLCSHTVLTYAEHVAAQWTLDPRASLEMRQCGGHRVHPISIKSTCSNKE